jgi:excisionase family DNA binding protein
LTAAEFLCAFGLLFAPFLGTGRNEMEVVVQEEELSLVLTVPEAARLLGISRTHAYGLVSRGELFHVRLGRRIVVPRHALEALLGVPTDRLTAS